ncbi:helix-turn-helix domain-containing protein [Bacillus pseudomycoides]|uniref:helix-turn-helix domain-containing protein n=1 Tax=Bacillus pseudomycoides TaxID=64104 RepID=UPI000BEBE13E|nr:helix-turn-helix domain-containing protein [Bacillus pseudomycoides]PEE40525.1 AraC family transcriptional regulator [Bacillus pseudomycoides]PEI95009.1 AraC family transcriptional regulator [Bacillus pseudomycoides]PGA88945.1 AraC family transcriptional regulator [Bacillus pseudomycoides]PHF35202.1 AraC family transcriptional regulator [Bacillus pseudomycoides]
MNHSMDIQYLCDILYETFQVSIQFVSTDEKILYKSTSNDICSPFYSSKEEQLSELFQENDLYNFPLLRGNSYLENFVFIRIVDHECIKGTFVIGPSTYPKVSEDMAIRLMNEFGRNARIQDGIEYYHSIPVIKKITLIDIGILLHYMIFKEKLDVGAVWRENKLLEKIPYKIANPDLYISARRQNSPNHYDIALERKFFTSIKEGDKEKLIKYAYAFPQEDAAISSKTNQLRNQKNNGIMAITLATRYAIEGNLPSEIAFSLSSLYMKTIEQLDNMYSVNRLIEDALCAFADRVKEYSIQRYSNTITICLNQISKNIYHEISLNNLAALLDINPTYLSKLFKQEVGIPLSEYIQRERVEEAKKLLTLTTYPLSDICAWLNFYDQSYFTRVFKKICHMTPRQYREKHTVI